MHKFLGHIFYIIIITKRNGENYLKILLPRVFKIKKKNQINSTKKFLVFGKFLFSNNVNNSAQTTIICRFSYWKT